MSHDVKEAARCTALVAMFVAALFIGLELVVLGAKAIDLLINSLWEGRP